MLEVMHRLGSIQFDPIAVAGRNHDLVLHARVAGYESAWCDELYERRGKHWRQCPPGLRTIRATGFAAPSAD